MKQMQYTKRKEVYNLGPRERVPCWGMQWVWAWQWDGNYGPQCWVPNFPKGLNSLAFVTLAVYLLSAWSIYIYLIYQKKKLKAWVSGNNYINCSIEGSKKHEKLSGCFKWIGQVQPKNVHLSYRHRPITVYHLIEVTRMFITYHTDK